MKLKNVFFSIAALLAIAAGIYLLRPHTFHGTVIQSPNPAFNFKLTSANGDMALADYRGKVVLVYFGFTSCVDICPITLANIAQALRSMKASQAEDVQLIMISLDPKTDTPEKLEEYVTQFYPSFIGVTGSEETLAEVASLYGIFYEKHGDMSSMDDLLDHTSTLFVLDREGNVKLVFPSGLTSVEIADDLKYILK